MEVPGALPTYLELENSLNQSDLRTAEGYSPSFLNGPIEASSVVPLSDALGVQGQADDSGRASFPVISEERSQMPNMDYVSVMPVSPWPAEQVLEEETSMIFDSIVNPAPSSPSSGRNLTWIDSAEDTAQEFQQYIGQHENPTSGQHNTYLSDLDDGKSAMIDTIVLEWPILTRAPKSITHLLQRKNTVRTHAVMTDNYLHGVMKSYLKGLVDMHLPPFIHPRSAFHNQVTQNRGEVLYSTEALGNAATIIPLFLNKNRSNHTLVMTTLFLEIQRLFKESNTFDDRTLLSAVQALALYAILFASNSGSDTECPIISFVLVMTIKELVLKVHERRISFQDGDASFPTWDEWVLAESWRRVILLQVMISRVWDIDIGIPATPSCVEINALPLPCSGVLWEADTEAAWEKAYTQHLASQKKGKHIASFGDLETLSSNDVLNRSPFDFDDLCDWSTQSDSFGALFLLVAKLK